MPRDNPSIGSLTLVDFYAGAALVGLLIGCFRGGQSDGPGIEFVPPGEGRVDIVTAAFELAERMVRRRPWQ